VAVSEPGPGEVLVRVAASGICATDYHYQHGRKSLPLPALLGHEGAGIVDRVGPGVTSVAPGDHVVLALGAPCGRCYLCMKGHPYLCERRAASPPPGVRYRHGEAGVFQFTAGTFAEYSLVHESHAIRIREDAPLTVACLIGCGVTTGLGAAIRTAKVEPGSSCLVIGCGGVGLSTIQGCRLAGAERIIACDVLDTKLAAAERFGATHIVRGDREDVVARSRELTGGRGVDYAFDVISTVPTVLQAFDAIRPAGLCVVVGILPEGTIFPIPASAMMEEKTLKGCTYGSARSYVDIPLQVDLYMSGKLLLDELVSQHLPLTAINRGLEDLAAGNVLRSVITMGA
jgi:Zn-dependent alcohol dehydrogenase